MGVLVDCKLNMMTLQQQNQILGCIVRCIILRQRYYHLSLLSAYQVKPGVLCPGFVPAIQERCIQTGKGSKKGQEDDRRAGEPVIWGKIEGVKSLLPGEEEDQGDLITEFQTRKVATRRMEFSPSSFFSQGITWWRQGAMGTRCTG